MLTVDGKIKKKELS